MKQERDKEREGKDRKLERKSQTKKDRKIYTNRRKIVKRDEEKIKGNKENSRKIIAEEREWK
jgi:hypothetical protein